MIDSPPKPKSCAPVPKNARPTPCPESPRSWDIGGPADWPREGRSGDKIRFKDLRGKSRLLEIERAMATGTWATTRATAYLDQGEPLCRELARPSALYGP